MIRTHLPTLLLLGTVFACEAPPDYGNADGDTSEFSKQHGTVVAPLQYTGPNNNTGLAATIRVYQNPANDCDNPGPLVMEERTEVTESTLALALLGTATTNQDPDICTGGINYCLEVVEDDPGTPADEGWVLYTANLGATLTSPAAWTAIDTEEEEVTMNSPNPISFSVCEGLDTEVNLQFTRGSESLVFGVGGASVSLEVVEADCESMCGVEAEEPGDLICVLVNSVTNPAAVAECTPSCEDNDDCLTACAGNTAGPCVGGGTPFPTNTPGFCYCP